MLRTATISIDYNNMQRTYSKEYKGGINEIQVK